MSNNFRERIFQTLVRVKLEIRKFSTDIQGLTEEFNAEFEYDVRVRFGLEISGPAAQCDFFTFEPLHKGGQSYKGCGSFW